MESELESLKASIKLTVQNKEEKEHGVQFLNDIYDDLAFIFFMSNLFLVWSPSP